MEAIFEGLFLEILIGSGGLILDTLLKLLGIKKEWGFSYNEHPLASSIFGFLLLIIPIHILNWGLSNSLFGYLIPIVIITSFVYISNTNFTSNQEDYDLLDDNFSQKK